MTGRGGRSDDMASTPQPAWRGARTDGDAAAEALLAGRLAAADDDAELRLAAEALAALTAPPARSELAAEPAARAAYRAWFGPSAPAQGACRRRHTGRGGLLRARLAVVAAAALTLGGVAAAAFAGVLPTPMQRVAHDVLAAPPARPGTRAERTRHPVHTAIPAGSAGPARGAHSLCATYARLKAHGSAQQEAVAFRHLAAAAGGPSGVTAYCAGLSHPGKVRPSAQASHPSGKSATIPAHIPPGQAGAGPAAHPSHGPAAHPSHGPAAHPSHGPAAHPSHGPAAHPSHGPAAHPSHGPAARPGHGPPVPAMGRPPVPAIGRPPTRRASHLFTRPAIRPAPPGLRRAPPPRRAVARIAAHPARAPRTGSMPPGNEPGRCPAAWPPC